MGWLVEEVGWEPLVEWGWVRGGSRCWVGGEGAGWVDVGRRE